MTGILLLLATIHGLLSAMAWIRRRDARASALAQELEDEAHVLLVGRALSSLAGPQRVERW